MLSLVSTLFLWISSSSLSFDIDFAFKSDLDWSSVFVGLTSLLLSVISIFDCCLLPYGLFASKFIVITFCDGASSVIGTLTLIFVKS